MNLQEAMHKVVEAIDSNIALGDPEFITAYTEDPEVLEAVLILFPDFDPEKNADVLISRLLAVH